MSNTILLTKDQYVHILNNNTGQIELIEGPYRGSLKANKSIHGSVRKKHVLRANQYCHILNPFKENKSVIGVREMRKGPLIFSLHPLEKIEYNKILIAFSLDESQGLYIINKRTGDVRLEKGPNELFLNYDERLYFKELTNSEYESLRLDKNIDKSKGIKIELDENEIISLVEKDSIRYELGPKTIFLAPFERPLVMRLSGETPKVPGVITTAIIRLGPDFLTDILYIRTKDNADLQIHVRYKWRFNIEKDNLRKLFSIDDFIGYASETVASMIRGIAAQHDFEDFHGNSSEIIKSVIFTDKGHLEFENGFDIFAVDIKQITPVDPKIAEKLNAAISSNMDVYVKKVQQQAELEAKRQLIEGEKVIEEQRKELITIQLENYEKETIDKAKIEAETEIEKAKGIAESELVKQAKMTQAEIDRVRGLIESLQNNPDKYLRLIELDAFKKSEKAIIVPEDARIWLPLSKANQNDYEDDY